MYEPMTFDDITPIEIPVRIRGTDYVMREIDEEAAAKFRARQLGQVQMKQKGGRRGEQTFITDLSTSAEQSFLLSLCMFNGDGATVPEATIKKWPSKVVRKLYDKAMEINDLRDDLNDPEAVKEEIESLQERLKDLDEKGSPAKN